MCKKNIIQQTIKKTTQFSGTALHSGQKVEVTFIPATADTGIVFKRTDLPDTPEIKASPFSVVSTNRCTTIGKKNKEYSLEILTIEHIMAALRALGIDNIRVEIDGPEIPIADGSSLPFYKILEQAGTEKLHSPRKIYMVEEPVWIREDNSYMVVLPYSGFKIDYTLQYDHPAVGTQFYEFDIDKDSFLEEIAAARTFGFKNEIDSLRNNDLVQGGSLDNAILIDEDSIINSLRFPDELVRHKILDIIGDLSLNGFIQGHVISVKSGHSLHIKLAKKLEEKIKVGV